MPRPSDKRDRLISAADRLILQQGFRQTTLSDIAEDSGVALGNLYYYFKSKEQIGRTVVANRIAATRALLERCSDRATPRDRLLAFLDHPLTIREELSANGCPLGTLAYELSRSDGESAASARALMEVVLQWAQTQFEALGRPDARTDALQFVTALQGTSLVANAMQDPDIVDRSVSRLRQWIGSL
jgi:AcrR family transcriptional regulator